MTENVEPYYAYQAGSVFIGNNKEQIKKTIDYYVKRGDQEGISIPDEKDILELEGDVNILVGLPILGVDHFINARVRPRAIFGVNANAFDYIQRVAANYEKLKRGELFKFSAGAPIFGLWFLPQDIMQGLRDYNWAQHNSQIEEWLGNREHMLEEGRRRGFLG